MNLIEAIAALRAHNSSGSAFLNTLGSVDGWKHGLGAIVDGKGNNMSSILFAAEWEARALGFPVPREDRGALDLSKWRRTEAGARLEAHAVRRPTMRRVPLPPATVAALTAYLVERQQFLAIVTPVLKGRPRTLAEREARRAAMITALLEKRAGADGSIRPLSRAA
jgi:hypothetical protein